MSTVTCGLSRNYADSFEITNDTGPARWSTPDAFLRLHAGTALHDGILNFKFELLRAESD